MDKKNFTKLIEELDKTLNKINDAIEEMNPRRKEVELFFGVTQELGWAVDEHLGRHKKRKPRKKKT